jgi:molecular chaperone GrpE
MQYTLLLALTENRRLGTMNRSGGVTMTNTDNQPQADHGADDELARARAEADELRHGWQRTQADFDNFRRRTLEERELFKERAAHDVLIQLAPVLDNFRRAFQHLPEGESQWRTGFQHIQKQLEDVLKAHGLAQIPTIGEPFNPSRHEAISELPHDTYPADTIIEEVEAGYECGGTIVKPAKVIVSAGPSQKVKEQEVHHG